MIFRCAAFNTGSDFHLLDHIAPVAELMQMPLITTEERNYELALKYYPQVETRFRPNLEFELESIAEEFDALFECKFWAPHLKTLFRRLYQKEMHLIFCAHGQSDKGFKAPLLAPYALQDGVLLYGDLLIDMLKQLNVWDSLSRYAIVGNCRFDFYQKYQPFYDQLAEKEIFSHLDRKKRTLLYAPTWKDADEATSFFDRGKEVITHLPSDWNLIVKVHPLLEQRDPAHFYAIEKLIHRKPNALLVSEFPPVYPILSRTDAYLGDFSSVGYDFLAFQRPLFFLPTDHPGRLHACGQLIDPSDLQLALKKINTQEKQQTELYQFAFGKKAISAKENILKMLHQSNHSTTPVSRL